MPSRQPAFLRSLLAVALAAAVLLGATACGKEEETQEPTQPTTPVEEENPQEQEETSDFKAPTFIPQIQDAVAKNSDVKGWLNIPDTTINNAVVQAADNDFYHRKDELKNYSWTGSFYADYECNLANRADLSANTVIYGHNVHYDDNKDKERFSQLFHFTDLDFAQEHPYVYFSINGTDPTLEENHMVWQIFSVFYTTTDFHYTQVKKDMSGTSQEEMTEEQLMSIVNEAKARSEYNYNVEVTGQDKILTLSTCSYKYGRRNDVRFVVMAKLLEEDAVLKNTVSLTENTSKKAVE